MTTQEIILKLAGALRKEGAFHSACLVAHIEFTLGIPNDNTYAIR